jgi:hypothetical protein
MIGVEEVKVHPEAGCSDRSEPQSAEREDGVKEAGSRTAGRWKRIAYGAAQRRRDFSPTSVSLLRIHAAADSFHGHARTCHGF